jgi:hypothetical protein
MLPAGQDAAEAFYRITDAAYERRFVAVTSKIPPGFDSIMPSPSPSPPSSTGCSTAPPGITEGDSHRLAEALTGKG